MKKHTDLSAELTGPPPRGTCLPLEAENVLKFKIGQTGQKYMLEKYDLNDFVVIK